MKNKLKIPTLILFSELCAQVLSDGVVLLNNIILDRTTYCTHTHQVTEKLGGGTPIFGGTLCKAPKGSQLGADYP